MGDVAMTVPVLLAFHKKYPNTKVVFLTKSNFSPIFSKLNNVNIHSVDVKGKHKGVIGIFKIFKELRQYKVDAVVDLHNVLRSKILRFLFSVVGVKSKKLNKGRSEKKKLTVWDASKKLIQLRSTHQRYAEVFEQLGFELEMKKLDQLHKKNLPQNFKQNYNILIGIAPFASFKSKAYPLDLLQETISKLTKVIDCQILLFGGGKSEKDQLQNLAKVSGPSVQNLAGVLSFDEELAIISNLDLMISTDSGNGHLAANFNIPVVTLWGVTHPCLGFAPIGQPKKNQLVADREKYPLIPTSVYGNKFPNGYENAIATIEPNQLVIKIQEVLRS
ncbi:glycosyltransferase family 9 protein [Muricauda sp. DJ-13]|uniref:Glycosyltransferase family 9 protein n=2 Tax=Croceivirga thetidis TaxID=2721623 RepID=A0ABX1GQF3_9FLAO|nr:glycosyltransferase family 9 protein [Croceivirga thetidis]NKI31185.1 glycosyltransferase family 9 protein [Croceivirga thetidis]